MIVRRLIALAVLAAALYVASEVRAAGNLGLLEARVFIVAVAVAIPAFAVAAFRLRWGTPQAQDSGFGISESVCMGIGALGGLVFALAPLFIALRGIYQRVMPALGAGPDIVRPVAGSVSPRAKCLGGRWSGRVGAGLEGSSVEQGAGRRQLHSSRAMIDSYHRAAASGGLRQPSSAAWCHRWA